ncbi:MAG: hypothetical protein KME18_06520 [Phormidium tanganyikae FI6-MK23]|jgi:hypothetical protein|nr:hypothetical protein [Phormidium tanganyikae FI6-MK23]
MRVSKLSPLQAFFYSGFLSCAMPLAFASVTSGIAQAAPDQPSKDVQMYAVGQASGGTLKTYQSQLGFRFDFREPYALDTSQEGKGTVVLRNGSISTEAIGSDEPAPVDSNVEAQHSPGDKITVTRFDNPQRLSARQWAEQNKTQSFFDGRQSDYRSYSFAGQPAVSYSWCGTGNCGDSVIVPSRDGRSVFVLSALYEYPGNAVRWDFKQMIGRFRLTQ